MGKVDDEVQELRKQVERLSAEKASTDSPQERSASEDPAADEGNDLSSLRAKLEEFMGTLDRRSAKISEMQRFCAAVSAKGMRLWMCRTTSSLTVKTRAEAAASRRWRKRPMPAISTNSSPYARCLRARSYSL